MRDISYSIEQILLIRLPEFTLYEDAMCCSTGICGPDPNAELVVVSAALDLLEDGYNIVVFDATPTGHTLRLLKLPSDWKGFMDLGSLTKGAASIKGISTTR